MALGISAAAWAGIGAIGSIGVGVYSASQQANAAQNASDAQSASAQAGIAEQQRQFDAVQKLLAPYVSAGTGALTGQQNLLGLNGNGAQQSAISALQKSPEFTSLLQAGNTNILQNASATGGLRGGNTQAALAQFSPQLLNQIIDQQYSRLGGLTSLGQNAAAGVGNAGMQTGNAVSNLLQQQGAAQAGNALAQGRAQAGIANSISSGIGAFAGQGGFGLLGGNSQYSPIFGYHSNPGTPGGEIDPYGYLGGANTAGDFSDVRLKTDIELLGIAPNGLPLYAFRYLWDEVRRIGHMAHEVIQQFPEAVSTHPSGYLMVDYAKV